MATGRSSRSPGPPAVGQTHVGRGQQWGSDVRSGQKLESERQGEVDTSPCDLRDGADTVQGDPNLPSQSTLSFEGDGGPPHLP